LKRNAVKTRQAWTYTRTTVPGGTQHKYAYPARRPVSPQTRNFSSRTPQPQLRGGEPKQKR